MKKYCLFDYQIDLGLAATVNNEIIQHFITFHRNEEKINLLF